MGTNVRVKSSRQFGKSTQVASTEVLMEQVHGEMSIQYSVLYN
jgi:hypothetical protein